MNNAPYTSAAGTAAGALVLIGWAFSLLSVHVVVDMLHWEPIPQTVIDAASGLLIGWLINWTHGTPAPEAGTADVVRSSKPVTVADPPPAAVAAPELANP